MAEKSTSQNDQFEHDQLHHREARAKPRPDQPSVVLGSPRVSRPLDFEILPQGIQDPESWGPISRSTNLAGLEHDPGWEAMQNR